jgi:hypothetical protein
MATELILINGVWVLRTATTATAGNGIDVTSTLNGIYDYVAPYPSSSIEILNFIQLSTSGSYT